MTEQDKEMIRVGRNKDFVRRNHVYQQLISKDQQEAWYVETHSSLHYILVINYHERDIGVVIVRDFLPDLSRTRCGAFLWDENYLSTKIPILSILIALDFFFCDVGIYCTESVVLKANSPSVKMNRFFGFEFMEESDDSFRIYMNRATYLANRDRLMTFAGRATKRREDHALRIAGSKSSLNLPEINALLCSMNEPIDAGAKATR